LSSMGTGRRMTIPNLLTWEIRVQTYPIWTWSPRLVRRRSGQAVQFVAIGWFKSFTSSSEPQRLQAVSRDPSPTAWRGTATQPSKGIHWLL
jgi:hypothetical protein